MKCKRCKKKTEAKENNSKDLHRICYSCGSIMCPEMITGKSALLGCTNKEGECRTRLDLQIREGKDDKTFYRIEGYKRVLLAHISEHEVYIPKERHTI